MQHSATRFRELAGMARRLATSLVGEVERDTMLELATKYERLADRADLRATH